MDPMVMCTAGAAVMAQLAGLAALGLRIHGRVQHERARTRALAVVAAALPAGGRVDERRPDGTRLVISVASREADLDG